MRLNMFKNFGYRLLVFIAYILGLWTTVLANLVPDYMRDSYAYLFNLGGFLATIIMAGYTCIWIFVHLILMEL